MLGNKRSLNFPFYIAKRYLISKKSTNVINIISTISAIGVAVVTMALVIILSVFNGFDDLITALFNSFDPDLKISIKEGKSFNANDNVFEQIKNLDDVAFYVEVLEENALVKYRDRQDIVTIKGVGKDYVQMSGIDSMLIDGDFLLEENKLNYALIGQGVAYHLSLRLNLLDPLKIYVPKRTAKTMSNPENAFNTKNIRSSGVFAIQPDIDYKYIIVPIDFSRELLDMNEKITNVEIKLNDGVKLKHAQKKIQDLLGDDYEVKDRYQQQEMLYKIMETEKWAIFLILTFILIIASFNVIGSLTMLIIDKKRDINILISLGADIKTIRNIFLIEGWLISIVGAVVGLCIGAMVCWVQQHYGVVALHGSGAFIIDAYPVKMKGVDFIYVFFTVIFVGFLASWYPVRYITRKYLTLNKY